jgi:hypothetical protein
MAEPTTSTRRPVRCSKHAFAPPVSFRPRNDVTRNVTLPAHRHQTCLGRARLASESPVAGDDPVNETDPSGYFPGVSLLERVGHDIEHGADDAGQWSKDAGEGIGDGAELAGKGVAAGLTIGLGVLLGGDNIQKPAMSLDSNVLIDAFQEGYLPQLLAVLGQEYIPVVSPTALSEYHHPLAPVMAFLVAQNGYIEPPADQGQVAFLQAQAAADGRVLHGPDANILSSALQDEYQLGARVTVLTGDTQFYGFMAHNGYSARLWTPGGINLSAVFGDCNSYASPYAPV